MYKPKLSSTPSNIIQRSTSAVYLQTNNHNTKGLRHGITLIVDDTTLNPMIGLQKNRVCVNLIPFYLIFYVSALRQSD